MIKLVKRQQTTLILTLCFALLNCEENKPITVHLEVDSIDNTVCEVLEDNKELRVLKCTFEPGVGHEKHHHNPHVGYTLAGSKFRITDYEGTREVDVPAGYSFSKSSITKN